MMLTVITGCMFAGKSSRLISLCTSHVIAGDSVVVFKPAIDNRYDTKFVVSHNLDKFACTPIGIDLSYRVITENIQGKDVVCFDEAQFFQPNQFMEVLDILFAAKHVKRIICAGLASDANGMCFGAMPELLAMADEIISLRAVCSKCKKIDAASKTYCKKKLESQISVGGSEMYEARCRRCWSDEI
jgi:thymidine kinase